MLMGPQNLPENIRRVRERIERATAECARSVDSVTLLAVSKSQPAASVRAAARAGLTEFGESYVQEALGKIEALRDQWIKAQDLEERQDLAAKIQARAFEIVPYIPTGQYTPKTAYRKNLTGVIQAPVILLWNVEKA